MDWLTTIGSFWLTTLAWLAGFAVVFGLLVRLWPCNPGMQWWKDGRAASTDFMYWFAVPLVLRACRTMMLILGVALLYGGRSPDFMPVRHLPVWVQALAILLIQDVVLYVVHRAFHTSPAWQFHAVHHSPTVLDWTAASRFHPVNHLLEFALADVLVLLLGFEPNSLAVLAPLNLAYSAMVHANLNWTFGPFRYLLASPVFHRWHHTTQAEGLNKNFASTFPFLDLLCGTFYMPADRLPEQFGSGEPDFPADFWGQLLHPFRGGSWRVLTGLAALGVLIACNLLVFGLYRVSSQPQAADLAHESSCAWGASGEQVLTGHVGAVLGVAVSTDGGLIASAGEDRTIRVWESATGRLQHTLTGHARQVSSVALSCDGRWLVSGSHDATVRVWDTETGREKLILPCQGAVLSVALSADGRHIAAGIPGLGVKLWDLETGRLEASLSVPHGAIPSVAVSSNRGCLVAANRDSVRCWDGKTGREREPFRGHTDLVSSVAISPDGRLIVSGGFDAKVKVWDALSGEAARTMGHNSLVYCVAVNPDGTSIVSGDQGGLLKVWDAATGHELLTLTGHTDSVTGIAFCADGGIISGSADGTVRVWKMLQLSNPQP